VRNEEYRRGNVWREMADWGIGAEDRIPGCLSTRGSGQRESHHYRETSHFQMLPLPVIWDGQPGNRHVEEQVLLTTNRIPMLRVNVKPKTKSLQHSPRQPLIPELSTANRTLLPSRRVPRPISRHSFPMQRLHVSSRPGGVVSVCEIVQTGFGTVQALSFSIHPLSYTQPVPAAASETLSW